MEVFKFGGASVKDADSVRNIAHILKEVAKPGTLIVISAMGKTTNSLEKLVNAYMSRDEKLNEIVEEIRAYHLAIADKLFSSRKAEVYNEIENVFVEMQWTLEEPPSFSYNHHYDQLVSQGEVLSTLIVSRFLAQEAVRNHWVDARGFIQTDNNYREGKVDLELSGTLVKAQLMPLLEREGLIITQGFIGGTSENFTTTLGREGSDYSAALFAFFCDAERVTIWKDVPGVLNADPKYFTNTKKIEALSYHDAIELTYYGASVIHPKTIKPLQNKNIPLYVKSFLHPHDPGTVISDNERRSAVTSYIFKDNQILLSIQPKDFSFIAEESLSSIFGLFSRSGVRVNMMQNSAISFSVCVDYDPQKIEPLIEELHEQFHVLYNTGVQLMTIRNYDQDTVSRLTENMLILLEQRSRNTHQMVMRSL
jgi:aspartate kinase